MSSQNSNIAFARRFIEEVLNGRRFSDLDQFVDDDCIVHVAGLGQYRGIQEARQFYETTAGAFGDLRVQVDATFAESDKVVLQHQSTGTNTGPALGMTPTGREARWTGVSTYRFAGSKIIEATIIEDLLGVLVQLGVVALPTR